MTERSEVCQDGPQVRRRLKLPPPPPKLKRATRKSGPFLMRIAPDANRPRALETKSSWHTADHPRYDMPSTVRQSTYAKNIIKGL